MRKGIRKTPLTGLNRSRSDDCLNPCMAGPDKPEMLSAQNREIIARCPIPGKRSQEKILFSDGSSEVRCYAPHRPHYYKGKNGGMYPIHAERKQKKTTADGETIELYSENVVSVGRKTGKDKNKYLGLRPDDSQDGSEQLEFTLIDVEFDGIKQDLDTDEIGIVPTRQRCRQLFPVTEKSYPEHDFKIEFELHITGLRVEKRDDLNEFWFYKKDNDEFKFRIRKPVFVDCEDNLPIAGTDSFIDHELKEKNGKYIYTKFSTKIFSRNSLPSKYWIDADTYWGSTADGFVYASASSWATVRGAATGTPVDSSGADSKGAGSAYHFYTPLVAPLQSNYVIYRGFVFFDTTGFGDYCTAATLSIQAYFNYDSGIGVFEKTGGAAVGPGSFDGFTGGSFGNIVWTNARKNITLNAGGRAYINSDGKVGFTQLCLRELDHDVANVAPGAETNYNNGMYFADYPDQVYDPYLSLTVQNYPTLTSPTQADVSLYTATLGANLTDIGTGVITERGVVWSTSTAPNISNNKAIATGTGTGVYTKAVTGLPAGTLIYYRGYATSTHGTGYSAQDTFTTLKAIPTLTSPTHTDIGATTATLGANLTSASGGTVTERGIVWALTTAPTTANNKEVATGTGTGVYTKAVTGLSSGTLVYYRGYAINEEGTGYSAESTFTTNIEPTVESPTVTDILDTSAIMGATLSNAGGTVTERGVVWALTTAPTTADYKVIEGGTAEGVYTDTVISLPAGVTIYFKGYAINEIGTGYSAELSFVTLETIVPSLDNTYAKILELDLSYSTILQISDIGIRTPTGYVEPKVLKWGTIQREINKPVGLPRKTTFTVEVDDADGTLLTLRQTCVFRGRECELKIGPEGGSLADEFRTIFKGKIVETEITSNASFIFTFSDVTFDLFSNTIGRVFNTTDFPNLPATVKWEVPNVVYGTVAKTGGAIPCQLVNTATYVYCAGRHPFKEITNVYAYGVLKTLTTDYTISESAVNGKTYTFITFVADPEDPAKYDPATVTIDAKGITDDNTSGGTLLENPATILEDYMENYMGLPSADIDTVLLATLENIFSNFTWTCNMTVTENLTHEDVITRITSSFNIDLFTTWAGKVGVGLYQTTIEFPWAESNFDDLEDIYIDSFREEENNDCINVVKYSYNRDYVNKKFDAEGTETHAAGVTTLGTEVPYEARLWGCRDATDAGEIATHILALQRTINDYIRFEASAIKIINNTELSRLAYITHEFNPETTTDHVFIKGITVDIENMSAAIIGIRTGA